MIGIRTDANNIIATGHMMRCITIADALIRCGNSVVFYIADSNSRILLDSKVGHNAKNEIVQLNTVWDDMESELPLLIKHLQSRKVTTLLVDSYKVTHRYFETLNNICKTAYIDDLFYDVYPLDILINYSAYVDIFDYESAYKSMYGFEHKPTKLLLGLKYAPLREQFYHAENTDIIEVKDHFNILLASGGGDRYGMLSAILSEALHSDFWDDNITWHVIVGDYSDDKVIESLASTYGNISVHKSVEKMASLMRSCDLAIVAAGTMLTECAAVKLPAVFYQMADNQKYGVQYWGAPGRMIFAGNAIEDKNGTISNIIREAGSLINTPGRLESIKECIADITDGRGAIRIAKELMEIDI